MKNPEQIITAMEALSPEDFRRVADWVADRDQELWDEQLKRDAAAGKLDGLAEQAREQHRHGLTRPV
jgi:hypothetical protein